MKTIDDYWKRYRHEIICCTALLLVLLPVYPRPLYLLNLMYAIAGLFGCLFYEQWVSDLPNRRKPYFYAICIFALLVCICDFIVPVVFLESWEPVRTGQASAPLSLVLFTLANIILVPLPLYLFERKRKREEKELTQGAAH